MPLFVAEHFADLPDPRALPAQRHELLDILVIALCAVICGADTFVDIARFGKAKEPWLKERLELSLPNGIPSHDTFGRVFAQLDPDAFSQCFQVLSAVREHWGIENRLHWVLDMAFAEDSSRIRKDHAPQNLATLRHLALNLLRQEKTDKNGVKARRLRAGWDNGFLLQVLTAGS